ncbi:nuclear transport factor 2 family protein [soil metagenome]|jgi:hypothetical protein|tara:strand:+ start:162 stop:491 length:330 start_codon:yes stop_codon:yes gene_type:complete
MAIALPDVIARYFAADTEQDGDAVSRCFTETATVKDEGHSYVGRDAIRQWKADSSRKYTYTVEPFSISIEDDRTVVTSHLVGDFPGSPVDLRYLFTLDDEKIAALEIVL